MFNHYCYFLCDNAMNLNHIPTPEFGVHLELARSQQQSIKMKPASESGVRRTRQQQKHRFLLLVTAAVTVLAVAVTPSVDAFSTANPLRNHRTRTKKQRKRSNDAPKGRLDSAASTGVSDDDDNNIAVASFDDAVLNRYACTRYQRHDGNYKVPKQSKLKTASISDPEIVKLAREALDLSTRAPTGFNAQPYKLLLVESVAAKKALSKYCIGRNRDRVMDSDCSVVFLADRQAMSSWKDYKTLLLENDSSGRNRSKTTLAWLKLRVLLGLFSSGIPLPKIFAGPISFGIRFAMRVFSWVARSKLVVPTLSSPECWSQKNTMLVAMAYMLGCSARGLDTTPMEGYLSWGIRTSLKIPRRYTIPLIVSTGRAYTAAVTTKDEEDDAGISHGTTPETATPRFPIESVIYENGFP